MNDKSRNMDLFLRIFIFTHWKIIVDIMDVINLQITTPCIW